VQGDVEGVAIICNGSTVGRCELRRVGGCRSEKAGKVTPGTMPYPDDVELN
jgi:hypothetical protein